METAHERTNRAGETPAETATTTASATTVTELVTGAVVPTLVVRSREV